MIIENTELKKERLWTKDFILVCIAGLLCNISIQMLNTTLAPFANDMWHSNALGGYLTSFFNIGSIAMAFVSGVICNKLGRRWCLALSAVIFGLPSFLMAFFPTPAVCLTVRVAQGMAKGMLYVSTASIVSDVAPQPRITEALGLYGLGSTLAFAIGPYIGLAVSGSAYRDMFVLCAILFLAGGLSSLFITYEKRQPLARHSSPAEGEIEAADKEYRGVWKLIEKKALSSGINYSICFASTSCILIFVATFSQEVLGYTSGQICLFYVMAALTMLFIRFFGGRLADRRGPFFMIIPGHVAIFILLLIMSSTLITKSYPLYLLCGAMYGLATAAIMPSMNAMAVLFSPVKRNGEANATFAFIQDFGILAASLTFGSVIDSGATPALGYRKMYLICLAIAVVSLLLSLVIYNKRAVAKAIAERENG